MSRTYRNTRYRQMWGSSMQWVLRDQTYDFDEIPFDDVEDVHINPWAYRTCWEFHYKTDSKEGKKRIARYLSDNGTYRFKEPGPSWFRNLFTERPQRRDAKRQLKKYIMDPDYEVILNGKDPLEYWT